MFSLLGGIFSNFGKTWFGAQIDTLVDKINRNLTVVILIAFAVLVSAKQYVGNPIHCRSQTVHDGNFAKYMDEICWVTNTYYIPEGGHVGEKLNDDDKRINYYQWVPLVLLVQALMFYLPHLLWQGMLQRSGLDISTIVNTGIMVHVAENSEEKEKKLKFMANQLDNYLTHYHQPIHEQSCVSRVSGKIWAAVNRLFCGKRRGSFLVILYVFVKILYVINVILQFFILDNFLTGGQGEFHAYGWQVFKSGIAGKEWPESQIFPKSTLCKFELVVYMANPQEHVVQCVLPINFFNDKLYIIIWFWLIFVAIATCANFLFWLTRLIFRVDRLRFIHHNLRAVGKLDDTDKNLSYKFVNQYLRQDGVFVIRLLNLNVSGLVAAQMAGELYDQFKKRNDSSSGFRLNSQLSVLDSQEGQEV